MSETVKNVPPSESSPNSFNSSNSPLSNSPGPLLSFAKGPIPKNSRVMTFLFYFFILALLAFVIYLFITRDFYLTIIYGDGTENYDPNSYSGENYGEGAENGTYDYNNDYYTSEDYANNPTFNEGG